ncbi:type II toxin-antitoxin system RelE/ParE family toxin [soil metagenome]
MKWQIKIERKAQKAIKKIPNPYQSNIIQAINELSKDPRPERCKKLKGVADIWRIRVSDYRIVYQIKDNQLKVVVIRIGHRSDIYDNL